MYLFGVPNTYALLVVGSLCVSAGAVSSNGIATDRVLRAATKRSDLYRRSVRISPKFELEVAYSESENAWTDQSTFASQVRVASQKPILNLEEVEHHLQDVECGDGTMKLHFVDAVSARDARFACHSEKGGLVVTSHETCNSEGARTVYLVNDVSFAEDGETLELSVAPSSWDDAFDRFDISFGHTDDDHISRRHADFSKIRKKRQAVSSPLPIPTNTPSNVNTATFNLSTTLVNKTFTPDSIVSTLTALSGISVPNVPIEIGCKNCVTTGQLVLTQGSFGINTSQIDLVPDVLQGGDDGKFISNVITGGFVELTANNVGAHLELFARPKTTGSYAITLVKIPVSGFVIPGIGQAGAIFQPTISTGFTVSGGVEINYGLEAQIPNDSKVRIDFADLTKSSIIGFPGSTLTPLPISANLSNVDILLNVAFKPSIPVGFEFESKIKAQATVSMNLPRLDAKLSTNVQANCGNKTTSLPTIGPLSLISANVSLTADVALDIALPALPSPLNDFNTNAAIFSTSFQLIKTCISPQDAFKTLTGIVAEPTSSSIFAHPTKSSTSGTTQSRSTASTASTASTVSSLRSGVAGAQLQKPTSSPTCTSTTTVWVPPPVVTASPVLSSSRTALNISTTSTSSKRPSSTSNLPAMVTTNASAPGPKVPRFQWTVAGLQMGFVGLSVVFGALMV